MSHLRRQPLGAKKPDTATVVADMRRAAAATGNRLVIENVESAILAVYPEHARYISRTARYATGDADRMEES